MSATIYTNPDARPHERSSGLLARLVTAENQVASLKRALHSSRVIGAAVGIVMAIEKLAYDDAFSMLAKASQLQNRKLHDIAEEVVNYGVVLGRKAPGVPSPRANRQATV